MRMIWSFCSGSPIYSSYQAPINKGRGKGKENASAVPVSGFMECGDDWSLYMHDEHYGKMRISESIAEFVPRTPTISHDGAIILGYREITLFEVEAKTGSIIRIHAKPDPDNASAPLSDDRKTARSITNADNKVLADPEKLNSSEPVLKIFRTDYFLKSVCPNSGIVLWNLRVAEFEAVLLCQHTTFEVEDENPSVSGLNFTMPYPCQEMQKVFRLKKNFLLEPLITESSHGAYHGNDILLMPTSDMMIPLQPNIDRFFDGHDDNMMMLPMPFLQQNNDTTDELFQPLIEIALNLNKKSGWSTPLPNVLFKVFGLVLGISVIIYFIFVKVFKNDREVWPNFNQVDEGIDGRRIGKLFVSNKEIAIGSNGTIIFDGRYEGRSVAVKRLVKAHHSVASKEIQNLIVSDYHPNIVRWHGVEHDQDFIYLALERCICNLDDLIQIYSDTSENSGFRKDQAFICLIKSQMETGNDTTQYLWKENGYPSPLLLKLMRDIVAGVVHLHELGIIHRDLKPQNVLLIKERSLCAKLSDMGISKRLLDNMSSLGHSATGKH